MTDKNKLFAVMQILLFLSILFGVLTMAFSGNIPLFIIFLCIFCMCFFPLIVLIGVASDYAN